MRKTSMRDIVILLPGLTGSILQRNGKDIWAPSGQSIYSALTSQGATLRQLKLHENDSDINDLDDGISATHLVPNFHGVPGLHKMGGYSVLSHLITDHFYVTQGTIGSNEAGNFFEFPYDWRQDNRFTAKLLQEVVEKRLRRWREYSGAENAKVILLAHSMGGLVARYYLEVLEGWRNCRALFTFGTPHRGSVNALNYLSNGYKKLFIDLTEVLRSFPSVYQLLPIYEVVRVADTYQRVAEVAGIPNVSIERAKQGLAFHREIEEAVNRHWSIRKYRDEYQTIPIVGTRQSTYQSATLSNGRLVADKKPVQLENNILLDDGDGIVPRISATPIELSNVYRDTFIAERHSLLHSHSYIRQHVSQVLKDMQGDSKSVRGSLIQQERAAQAAISIDLDDLYLPDEAVELHATIVNQYEHPSAVEASIEPIGMEGPVTIHAFHEVQDGWKLVLEDLPAGMYRVEVRTQLFGPESPTPVHDFFEVLSQ